MVFFKMKAIQSQCNLIELTKHFCRSSILDHVVVFDIQEITMQCSYLGKDKRYIKTDWNEV